MSVAFQVVLTAISSALSCSSLGQAWRLASKYLASSTMPKLMPFPMMIEPRNAEFPLR